jgi:hypothetical protein
MAAAGYAGPDKRAELVLAPYPGALPTAQARKDGPTGGLDGLLPSPGLARSPADLERASRHAASLPGAGRERVRPPAQGPPRA